MGFFDQIKTKLEETLEDLTTIEHAMIDEETGKILLYQRLELEGDSLGFTVDHPLTSEQQDLFVAACEASATARTALGNFIVACIK